MDQNQQNIDALANAVLSKIAGLAAGGDTTTKGVVSGTPTASYGHGNGGLFSSPALERPVFSAMMLPNLGVQSMLPLRPSLYDHPLFAIFTGVTATTGTGPNGVCDDPPTVGTSKLCSHSFWFGRQELQTPVYDVDRVGRLTHRGEHLDLQFQGNPWQTQNPNVPTQPGAMDVNGILNSERNLAMWNMAVAWARDFAKEFYTGNPSNNSAGGGRKYFYGMDALINTGYRDAETGQACPAADSIVRSFQGQSLESTGGALVREITNIYRNLRYIASAAGLEPAKWVIAMKQSLFYELSEVWPCAYNTYRCTGSFSTTQVNNINNSDLIRERDAMRGDIYNRRGQFLLIDGERVPVVLDDAIVEDGLGAGSFRSSIYFIPMTVLGGMPVTYMQYLDYNAPNGALAFARAAAPAGFFDSSDNGRFLWHYKPPNNFCVQWLVKTEPRLLLLTPHLAARLTNIRYTPLQHEREAWTDSPYFADGGRTDYIGYGPSYHSPTA